VANDGDDYFMLLVLVRHGYLLLQRVIVYFCVWWMNRPRIMVRTIVHVVGSSPNL